MKSMVVPGGITRLPYTTLQRPASAPAVAAVRCAPTTMSSRLSPLRSPHSRAKPMRSLAAPPTSQAAGVKTLRSMTWLGEKLSEPSTRATSPALSRPSGSAKTALSTRSSIPSPFMSPAAKAVPSQSSLL